MINAKYWPLPYLTQQPTFVKFHIFNQANIDWPIVITFPFGDPVNFFSQFLQNADQATVPKENKEDWNWKLQHEKRKMEIVVRKPSGLLSVRLETLQKVHQFVFLEEAEHAGPFQSEHVFNSSENIQ